MTIDIRCANNVVLVLVLQLFVTIKAYAMDSVVVSPGIHLLKNELRVNRNQNGSFPSIEFTLHNSNNLKEARFVLATQEFSKDFGELEKTGIVTINTFFSPDSSVPIFSHSVPLSPVTSMSVPLAEGNLLIQIELEAGKATQLLVSVGANFRNSSIRVSSFDKESIRKFDKRYISLHSQAGVESVYETTGENILPLDSLAKSLFSFDYLNELKELFEKDCEIEIINGTEEYKLSVNKYVSSVGRNNFSYSSRLENVGDPIINAGTDTASIRSTKRIIGQERIGSSLKELFRWNEEAVVALKGDRIVAKHITREMINPTN